MITRFDHAVIAERDLEVAMRRLGALGFAVSRGGRHPGHGTENAIVRFGLDYLELLAVADANEAQASGLNGRGVLAYLAAHSGGLVGFALASDDLARDAARLRASGLPVEGPFPMRRERPDGSSLAWHLAIPGGTPWRRPWPFLIEWETPDSVRLAHERLPTQPNGVLAVAGLAVAVADLDAAIGVYQQGLALPLIERRAHNELGAEGARFAVGGTLIELLAPHAEGTIAEFLRAEGEGPLSVRLVAPELAALRDALATAGVSLDAACSQRNELHVPPVAAGGARLVVSASET